ncbi:MAG TPA: hypothetical protein DCY20_04040 [Firmicutes bacterium]|nr:hypothetical protein [Bacillota bacterium]
MNEQLISSIIENHTNGYVILNQHAEVVYANKAMKQLTKNNYGLFGNFMGCINTTGGRKCYEDPEKCSKCLIRKNLKKIMQDKEKKWLVNVDYETVDDILQFDCFMDYVDDYICIEIFNLTSKNPNLFVLDKVLDSIPDLIFYKDSSLTYRYTNQAYADFLGQDKHDIISKTDADLLPAEILDECLESDYLTLENGEARAFVEMNGVAYAVSKKKVNNGIFATVKDVTQEYALTKLAFIDELTGLPNRRVYIKDMETIYEHKKNHYYLVLIDLDHLREINNNFGHQTGDVYLKTLGDILANISYATFYRLAGDEFAGMISGSKEDAVVILQKIYKKIEELELNPKLTISTGVKKIDLALTETQNYELTDQLLYQAKREGRNNYCLAED